MDYLAGKFFFAILFSTDGGGRVAFRDALLFLYQKAKANGEVRNQAEFAKRFLRTGATINQYLTGQLVPPHHTIIEILQAAGYKLEDCIELPEMIAERRTQGDIAIEILKRGDGHSRATRHFLRCVSIAIEVEEADQKKKVKTRLTKPSVIQ